MPCLGVSSNRAAQTLPMVKNASGSGNWWTADAAADATLALPISTVKNEDRQIRAPQVRGKALPNPVDYASPAPCSASRLGNSGAISELGRADQPPPRADPIVAPFGARDVPSRPIGRPKNWDTARAIDVCRAALGLRLAFARIATSLTILIDESPAPTTACCIPCGRAPGASADEQRTAQPGNG